MQLIVGHAPSHIGCSSVHGSRYVFTCKDTPRHPHAIYAMEKLDNTSKHTTVARKPSAVCLSLATEDAGMQSR